MNTSNKNLFVTISANDIDLDSELAALDRTQLGFYISVGTKLLDVLVLSSGQNTVKVPLSSPDSKDKVIVIVKSLGRDEVKVGSISIPQEVFFNAGESKHKQWITLFDHLDDDEYDGEMGENDDEQPRVLFTFDITQETQKSQKPAPTQTQTQPAKPKHNLNQGRSPVREPVTRVEQKKPEVTNKAQPQSSVQQPTTMTRRPLGQNRSHAGNTAVSRPQTSASEYKQQNPQQNVAMTTPTPQPQILQQQQHQQAPISTAPFKQSQAKADDFDIQREIQKDPSKKYKVAQLQKLLDDKLSFLIKTINQKQKENFNIEDEVLNRLTLLKSLNSEIEQVYKKQGTNLAELQKKFHDVEAYHNSVIENDEEKHAAEGKVKELEKTFQAFRVEVENVTTQNEKLSIQKEERLAKDLNSREAVDRKENQRLRVNLEELIVKRHDQLDQERDYNRDIYQLAKDYKRKVEEFNSILISYSNERNDLTHQIQVYSTDLLAEKAFLDLDSQRQEKFKNQITLLKDTVKNLEQQIEDKKSKGEELYNQHRDALSVLEDRQVQLENHQIRMSSSDILRLQQEKADCEYDIERIENLARQYQQLPKDLRICESELIRARDQREKVRLELEQIKKKLEVVVDVRILDTDLEEAKHLCKTIEEKDRNLILQMMRARDDAKKDWLKNWVNTEVHELMRRDRDDVRNHIEMYSDDLQKLSKIIDKFQQLQAKQQERFQSEQEELRLLENEMKMLNDERRDCERELKKIESDMQKLRQELENKKQLSIQKDKEIESLEQQIGNKDLEIDRLNEILNEKDDILQSLEDSIRQTGETLASSLYSAIKGDLVDELLAKYINLTQCPVPIKRLGNGYYLFGTKKIFAKIMNGKLVIRVGGGFMVIEEFIAAYAEQEMKKIHQMEQNSFMNEDSQSKNKGYSSLKKSPRASGGSPRIESKKK